MKSLEELHVQFLAVSGGIRVLMLVHRSKDGGSNNKRQRDVKKAITQNSEEFFKTIRDMQNTMKKDSRQLRIYAACNSRDINKAINLFKHRQLDLESQNKLDQWNFYTDIDNRFISCLMNPGCRLERNFLFDIDTSEISVFLAKKKLLQEYIITHYKTPNGLHIITKPFNYVKFLKEDQDLIKSLHTDGQLLIDF